MEEALAGSGVENGAKVVFEDLICLLFQALQFGNDACQVDFISGNLDALQSCIQPDLVVLYGALKIASDRCKLLYLTMLELLSNAIKSSYHLRGIQALPTMRADLRFHLHGSGVDTTTEDFFNSFPKELVSTKGTLPK